VADEDGGGKRGHARLGGGLRWGRMREGGERQQRQRSGDDGCGGGRRRRRMTMAKAEKDSGKRQWHARLGCGLRRGRKRAGGERRRRQRSGNDGYRGRRWRRQTTTAAVDNNGNGRRKQRWTTKVADDDGTQDQAADYKGEGGEQAANNNGIRPAGQITKIKKLSLRKKTFFSNTVCPVGVFAPAENQLSFF
jgi:hypothetical protein